MTIKLKSFIIIISVVCSMCLLGGCQSDDYEDKSSIHQAVLVDESYYHKVYIFSYNNNTDDYMCFIFDKNGEKLDSACYQKHCPKIEELNSDILKSTLIYGTDAYIVKYYDITNSIVSPDFQGVCYNDEEKVAYIDFKNDKTYLKIQKMFSDDVILKEELNLGDAVVATTSSFDVSISGDTVTVKHPYGSDYKTITETFLLNN
ncbi:MAG: hypothetical protein J1E96_04075 [Ruminococcus sp.]|nr:hypothetical protein [Ruminococcus sp.]